MPYKNKEDAAAQKRRWRLVNSEKVAETQRRYRENNPYKYADKRTKEQHKIKNNLQRESRRKFLYEQKGEKCCQCGSTENLEFDHINPSLKTSRQSFLSMGLETIKEQLDNIQVLCHDCHKSRSTFQKNAAWKLFTSLPLEEQERLISEQLLIINNR